ncbi:MAG TPA: hypothetical protein VN654_02225 [Vicinamibacterales bacterium]|jgi:hypothetical protein|nr:hypothetical protein [Vicinamibacterales bacterium]
MTNSKSVRTGLAAAALAMLLAASGHALGYGHENKLTFNGPVALPGVVLPAGLYSFNVASDTALDIVVVSEARSGKRLYMGFTNTVTRPRAMSKNAPIAFGEATANQPRPIAAWYELGATVGHQFLYR